MQIGQCQPNTGLLAMYPKIVFVISLVLAGVVHPSEIPGLLIQKSFLSPVGLTHPVVTTSKNSRRLHGLNAVRQTCQPGTSLCPFDEGRCCPPGCTIPCPGPTCCTAGEYSIPFTPSLCPLKIIRFPMQFRWQPMYYVMPIW